MADYSTDLLNALTKKVSDTMHVYIILYYIVSNCIILYYIISDCNSAHTCMYTRILKEKRTALVESILRRYPSAGMILDRPGVDVLSTDSDGKSPLLHALEVGMFDVATRLLSLPKCNLNATDKVSSVTELP